MAEHVETGLHGALATDDPEAKGCHVVQWTSNPCTLQEDAELTECAPPEAAL